MPVQNPNVRPPAVAGQFYPDRPSELRLQVEDMLGRAPDAEVAEEVRGLIAPHAGYPYSGQTAAVAYRQVRGKHYDFVVIMAPSHQEACNEVSIFPGEGYETPLGVVPVDRDVAHALAREDASLHLSPDGHRVVPARGLTNALRGEHAVEVQIPFLQVVLPNLQVVPIVMNSRSFETCLRLADALVRAAEGKKVLIVASSDLYHGYDYDECVISDACTLSEIEAFDPNRFATHLETGRVQACGGGPILALMLAADQMGAHRARVVSHTNSSDVVGKRGGYVVGYGAALFYDAPAGEVHQGELTETDRAALGQIAREAVQRSVCGNTPGEPTLHTPGLRCKRGAFVTLRCQTRLRGCIGDIRGDEPLGITIQNLAVAAASRDPRFPPLSEVELGDLEIEVSVLGAMQRVTTPSEIEVGRDGLCIRRGKDQGILLPQVAVEQGWDRSQFLNHTCLKAQLPPTAWQHPDTEIWTFAADVFSAD